MLFRHIVFYALLIGSLSGLVLTAVQFWQVIPIIQNAEVYETQADKAAAHSHDAGQAHSDHDHSGGEWAPQNGTERTAFTLLSNVLMAIGFALILLVSMVALPALGRDKRYPHGFGQGLMWGAAGYLVFWLAPALGLPPEIPGASAASLEARQVWWLFTVLFTAAGLAGLAFGKSPWRWAALVLLIVPHLVGAPHPPGAMFEGHTPEAVAALESLADRFIGASAIANAVFWLAMGLAAVWCVQRIVPGRESGAASKMESPSV